MKQHTHAGIDDTRRGYGSGTLAPDCSRPGCAVQGAHITVKCRCGAIGVICPSKKRIHWRAAHV